MEVPNRILVEFHEMCHQRYKFDAFITKHKIVSIYGPTKIAYGLLHILNYSSQNRGHFYCTHNVKFGTDLFEHWCSQLLHSKFNPYLYCNYKFKCCKTLIVAYGFITSTILFICSIHVNAKYSQINSNKPIFTIHYLSLRDKIWAISI